MKKKTRTRIDPIAFVRAWQRSSCIAEVAKILDMSRQAVSNRAFSFRKKGVKLKIFTLGRRFDADFVAEANALITKEKKR